MEIQCCQFTDKDRLTEEQYRSIAELIWDTDPYIYPALFGAGEKGRENAYRLLPAVFEDGGDSMFAKGNLFTAQTGGEIVGLVLWYRGLLSWNAEILLRTAEKLHIPLDRESVEKVNEGYVSERYSSVEAAENAVSLINVCVRRESRGQGIATRMLSSFLRAHPGEPMELAVLAENPAAVGLYRAMGFRITEETDGFSLNPEKPKCYTMTRPATV